MTGELRETAGANSSGGRTDAAASVDDAIESEVSEDVAVPESGSVAIAENLAPGWDEALAYADYLHTDAVLLVLGVWLCVGIMLARILLDRVVK